MRDKRNQRSAVRFARTSVLSALAVVLSFIEGMLPELPIPGARLGLSNLVVMTSIDIDGLFGGLSVCAVKAFFAFITRGPVAGVMSFSGGLLSSFVMWVIIKYDKNKVGYIGLGVCGAVCHNIGQLCVAFFIMRNTVLYYVPFFLLLGVFTGFFTGFVNSFLLPAIKKACCSGVS